PLRAHRRHLAVRPPPRPAAAPRPAQRPRRRRGRGYRTPLHARPHLPPDAHHPRKKCARLPRHLGRPLAGLPHAALRSRRPHPPGPPLQIPPRTHPRPPPRRPRRPRTALLPARQTPGPRAPRLRTCLRAQTGAISLCFSPVIVRRLEKRNFLKINFEPVAVLKGRGFSRAANVATLTGALARAGMNGAMNWDEFRNEPTRVKSAK